METKMIMFLAEKEGTSPFENFAIKLLKMGKFPKDCCHLYDVSVTSQGFKLGLAYQDAYLLTDSSCKLIDSVQKNPVLETKWVEKMWVEFLEKRLEPYQEKIRQNLVERREYCRKMRNHYAKETKKLGKLIKKEQSRELN